MDEDDEACRGANFVEADLESTDSGEKGGKEEEDEEEEHVLGVKFVDDGVDVAVVVAVVAVDVEVRDLK